MKAKSEPEEDNVKSTQTEADVTREDEAPEENDAVLREHDEGGLEEARMALAAALDKKAYEPMLLDVRKLCSYTSYILLLSGRSDRQVEAITEGITTDLRKQGIRALGSEGTGTGQWSLVDFGDVVVHVFHHPVRAHYDLEGLWNDAPRVAIDVPDEARLAVDDAY